MPWIQVAEREVTADMQFLTVGEQLVRFRTVSGAASFSNGVFGQVLRLPRPPATVQSNLLPGFFFSSTDDAPRCLLLETVPSYNVPLAVWWQRTVPRANIPWRVAIEEFRREEIGVQSDVTLSDAFVLVQPSSSARTSMIVSYQSANGVDLRFDNTGRLPVTIPLYGNSGVFACPDALAQCQLSMRRRDSSAAGVATVITTR